MRLPTLLGGLLLAAHLAVPALAAVPNVLFISVDDLRPDLGCYGDKVAKTPNIDRLAGRGVMFGRAYCQQAVCSPSRSSLMTGRRPDATKVWDLATHFRVALPDAVTLPQHFKANGYHAVALNKIYHHGFEDGASWSEPHWYPGGITVDTDPKDASKRIVKRWGDGVTEANALPPDPADRTKDVSRAKGNAYQVSDKADDELPDGLTAAEAVKRLHELKGKQEPFFLAVGFVKPHLPFVAPKKYWDLYDPADIPPAPTDTLPEGAPPFVGHASMELHSYANVPAANPVPDAFAKTLRHGYYAATSYTDALVGRLLDALDKEGLAENTVIVLWGDHGWQLGEHGIWTKHTNFEIAARAPLIVAVPGSGSAGKRCDVPAEFVDVYPTLADVCGLSVPKGLDGISLKPFLDRPDGRVPADRVAITQYPRPAANSKAFVGAGVPVMGYSVRDARYRYTAWMERGTARVVAAELYDEQADPNETVNLAAKPELNAVVASLAKHLPAKAASAGGKKRLEAD